MKIEKYEQASAIVEQIKNVELQLAAAKALQQDGKYPWSMTFENADVSMHSSFCPGEATMDAIFRNTIESVEKELDILKGETGGFMKEQITFEIYYSNKCIHMNEDFCTMKGFPISCKYDCNPNKCGLYKNAKNNAHQLPDNRTEAACIGFGRKRHEREYFYLHCYGDEIIGECPICKKIFFSKIRIDNAEQN